MKLRNLFFIMFCLSYFIPACKQRNNFITPKYPNKEVYLELKDSLILFGSNRLILSNNFTLVSNLDTAFVLYDHVTKNVIKVNSSATGNDSIVDFFNLADRFMMYPNFLSNMLEVKQIGDQQFILISFPFSIIVDSDFNFICKVTLKGNEELYTTPGNKSEICFSPQNNCIYYPIIPDLPATHKDYYSKGRIIEVNLHSEKINILPIGLPVDFESWKNYGLFSLPHITIWENYLFYIYPGSKILYKFDLNTHQQEGILLAPSHADITATEFTGNVFDQIKKHAESAKFFRIIGFGDLILLYYQTGIDNVEKNGYRNKNTYVIAYSPSTNEVVCDISMNIADSYNTPTFLDNDFLYYLKDETSSNLHEIKASFFKYKLEIH
jgi:hypothetical protein